MSKSKRWITAAVAGLVAGGLHHAHLRALEREARGGDLVEVMATAEALSAGEAVEERALAVRRVPEAYVDGRVVRRAELRDAVGLIAQVSVDPGQLVQWTDLLERPDPGAGDLARLVAPGDRAITIPVDASLGMGGLLRPGHRVDILGTFQRREGPERGKITVTLLQNIPVLATGRDLGTTIPQEGRSIRFSTATLSVSLEEGELLALASSEGTLSLVLRGDEDTTLLRDMPERRSHHLFESASRDAPKTKSGRRTSQPERLRAR